VKDFWLGLGELARAAWGLLLSANFELMHWSASLRPLAVACVAVLALTAAVIGARRPMVRLVAGAAGVGLGFAYAARFEPWLPFLHVSLDSLGWDLALVFGIFGAATPEGFTFVLSGLLFGSGLASLFRSSERAFAFLPGFLLGGAAGVMAFPFVAALVSSFGGGWVCACALAALFPKATLGGYLESHPLATFGIGLAIGAAGFVGQLSGVHVGRLGVPTDGGPSLSGHGARAARGGKAKRAASSN
jgi:hypothetical protein